MKTVLITGANRGIGWQTAQELSGMGFRVYVGSRTAKANGEPVREIKGEAFWIRMDVSGTKTIGLAANWLAKSEDKLDVLINNAAIYPDGGASITTISRAQMNTTFQSNVFGVIEVTQALLPLLRRSQAARVINVSSGYGQLKGLSANVPSYCLSKLSLNGVTLMLADNLRADGISVNSVDPGWVGGTKAL